MVNCKLVSGAFALACCSSALLSASAAQAPNFSAEYVLASIRRIGNFLPSRRRCNMVFQNV